MSNDLKGGMTNLSGVYGTLLPDNNLNYSVQVGNTHGGNTSSGTSGYSSLNYRGAYGNTNVGYSRSGDSSQIYYGMSGGIIAHADGITFGQPLGDTMVLVKAPGADNVKIENQTGIHTDWRGYAILPFATEYRENRVALNANSLADNVELDETVVTVIPTHGAIARATFNAQIGGKVLMTLNIQIELRDDQDAALKNGDSKTVIVDEITRNAQFPLKARAITVNGNASQGTIEALINVIYTWQ